MRSLQLADPRRWPWPLPALGCWLLAWLVWQAGRSAGWPPELALAAATSAAAALALRNRSAWRRLIAAAGFPLALLLLGSGLSWPAWSWLLLALPLLVAYPMRAWADAPFFPTPRHALHGLGSRLPAPQRVLDAGCGLGHGLRALHELWPQAHLRGVEWSPLLALAARLACPWAEVRRGDMWALPWQGHDLVYVFQRPESMPRVWAKARAELDGAAFLVSLEFEVPGQRPYARLQSPGGRPVWVYRPGRAGEQGGVAHPSSDSTGPARSR